MNVSVGTTFMVSEKILQSGIAQLTGKQTSSVRLIS